MYVRHSELPGGLVSRLLPHLLGPAAASRLTEQDYAAIHEAGSRPSKDSTATEPFENDSSAKRRSASEAVVFWANALASARYQKAVERSCARPGAPPAGERGGEGGALGLDLLSYSKSCVKDMMSFHGEDKPSNPAFESFSDLSIGTHTFTGGIVGVRNASAAAYHGVASAAAVGNKSGQKKGRQPKVPGQPPGQGSSIYPCDVSGGSAGESSFQAQAARAVEAWGTGNSAMADACWRAALVAGRRAGGGMRRIDQQGLLENLAVLEDSLTRSSPRVWHGKSPAVLRVLDEVSTAEGLAESAALSRALDAEEAGRHGGGGGHAEVSATGKVVLGQLEQYGAEAALSGDHHHGILVFDGMVSDELCDLIVELFGKSPQYQGNLIRDGQVIVDLSMKRTSEVEVHTQPSPVWAGVEFSLSQAMAHAFSKYESRFPGMSFLPNPLHDEGFRVKRYEPGTGVHAWHVDRSSSDSCREVAVLIYLNDCPSGGGETLFRTPAPVAVKPKKGRVLLFPAQPSHLHAGAPPAAEPKFVISNFIGSCDQLAKLSVPPIAPLSTTEIAVVRTHFSAPPQAWQRPADGSGADQGVPWPVNPDACLPSDRGKCAHK